MNVVFKIFALCAIASVTALLLKKNTPDIALAVTLATVSIIFYMVYDVIGTIISFAFRVTDLAELSPPVVTAVIKTAGIAVVSRFASDICKEAGMPAAASACEFGAGVIAVYIAIPLVETMLDMIRTLW